MSKFHAPARDKDTDIERGIKYFDGERSGDGDGDMYKDLVLLEEKCYQ